jgi:threonine/homoserine/homoserine lactone efflux protein
VGPINLTILNQGAQRGFRWACLIGFGAGFMEVVYCSIAFTGFSSFFQIAQVKTIMEALSVLFLIGLGLKFLLVSDVVASTHIAGPADKLEERIRQRFNPTSAFMTGLVRTMGNPGVLLFWIFLAAHFMAHEWVRDNLKCKIACVVGVGTGISLWFVGLSRAVSLGKGRFDEQTLLRIEHFSGLGLIALGVFDGVHLVWHLARHKV